MQDGYSHYFAVVASIALDATLYYVAMEKIQTRSSRIALYITTVLLVAIQLYLFGYKTGILHSAYTLVACFTLQHIQHKQAHTHKELQIDTTRESAKPVIRLSNKEHQLKDILIKHSGTITRDELKDTYGYNANSIRVYLKGLRDKGVISTDENGTITLL